MPLSLTSVPTFEQYQSDPTVREKLNNYFRASGWQISGDVKFADQYQNAINTLKTNVDKANQQEVLSGGAQSSGFSGSNIDTAMKYGLVSGSITPDQNYYNDINQFTTQKAGGTGNYSWITAPQPFTPTKGANQYQLGDTKTTGGTLSTVIQPQNLTSPGAGMPKGSFTSTPDATHTLKAYDTNNNYATVYVKPGEYVPGVSLTPKPQDNLTSESFQKQSGADLTGTISPSTNNLSSEANVAANQTKLDIKGIQDLYNQSMSESQKQADTLSTQLSDLLGQEAGKAAYTTQKTQELVDPLQKQLTSVNNQISALQAEQNQAHLDAQGKPMTLARLSGEEARIDAQYNSRIFTLTAQANSLMNNIELAQTQVKRAVDAIYAPIDESIAIKKAQLEAIQPILTRYEKIQSMAVSNYLTQQQEELNQLKSDVKDVLATAIKSGINDASILDKITSATSGAEAYKILAQNMPTIDPNISDLQNKYPDAGILPTDTFVQAQAKLANSRIYRQQTRLAGGGGGVSTSSGGVHVSSGGNVDISKMSAEAQAVINGTLRLEDLTPTVRGKIAGELIAAGYQSKPNLSSTQQDQISTMKTVSGLIDQVLAYNADGKLEGIGSFGIGSLKSVLSQVGFGSNEGQAVRALIGNIKGTIAKLRGGTSFTPNEEKLLNTYTPTINDSPSVAVNKLHLLQSFIAQKNSDIYSTAQLRGVQTSAGSTLNDLRAKYNY